MKATISGFERSDAGIWEGEVVNAIWNGDKGEFAILGNVDNTAFDAVVASILEKHRLTIGIEDPGTSQLVMHGYVDSAKFQAFDSDQVECSLVVSLDDQLGDLKLQ